MTRIDIPVGTDPGPDFESRLVQQLQPIRGFVLACSLYHLFDLGMADAILSQPFQPISDLAHRLDLNPIRLKGFLLFLQVEGFVQINGGLVSPLSKLAEMREAWPWYEMLIGGYAQTYLGIGNGLRAGSGVLSRNVARVGSGSCKISHYDAIPLTKILLGRLPNAPRKVIDLGCGNALYLMELCSTFPGLVAIGVEPDEDNYLQFTATASPGGRDLRIKLYQSTAQDFIKDTHEQDADVLIIAFVLHEILSQDGRQGVIEFLKKVISRFSAAHIVAIEVDNKAGDVVAMSHPLAVSYYNPYFLAHYFTNQLLQVADFWLDLFDEAGLQLISRATTNPNVDSTGLELGFLLKHA